MEISYELDGAIQIDCQSDSDYGGENKVNLCETEVKELLKWLKTEYPALRSNELDSEIQRKKAELAELESLRASN